MPVQPRAADSFTPDNLLLGFSQVFFTPTGGSEVPIGILSSQSLEKVVETIELPRADSGTITVARRIVSRLEFALALETFNLRSDVARYIFGSDVLTSVVADSAAVITDEAVTLPSPNPFSDVVQLDRGEVNEASVDVECDTITGEVVGTGTGAANNFVLDYKVKAVGDVTSVTVGGVAYTPVAVGAAAAGNEVEVVVGEVDGGHPTTSGSLEFHVGGVSTPPANGAQILATYKPSFDTTGGDIVSLTDFVLLPLLGQIRFLDPAGADNSPFRTTGDQQPLLVDYTYVRRAHTLLQPGRQNSFDGAAVIRHLPDVGVNFIWNIPSATIRLTDDALTFGSDDLATGTLSLEINDAGGTDRFGTIEWSSEPESGA